MAFFVIRIAISVFRLFLEIALNHYYELGYKIQYWHTESEHEIDFVLYGQKSFIAIEVKQSSSVSRYDLKSLKLFLEDYPEAKAYVVYGGNKKLYFENKIEALPILGFLKVLPKILKISA